MDNGIDVEQWKSGTDTLAMCMICGGEYATDLQTCPDCDVSLTKVRRCPQCRRVVSFQHTKCVYCRTPFLQEPRLKDLATSDVIPQMPQASLSKGQRAFRAAAVSVLTFVVVFTIGALLLARLNRQEFPVRVLAKSYALRGLELRHAPSANSATVDSVAGGAILDITGRPAGEHGQRWMTVQWKNQVAYVLAKDIAPPKALSEDGADILNYYLLSMENAEVAEDAAKAVDYYAKAFPGDVHADELRWVLAERLRYLAQHGSGSEAASLKRRANQQFEQLAASDGRFAEKARESMSKLPSSATESSTTERVRARKPDEIEVVGGAGTQTSMVKSSAHSVLVLNQAEVIVRAGKLSQMPVGTVVSGRVARAVKANGILAIPAGASCQVQVVSDDPSSGSLAIGLMSVNIDSRSYPVKSRLIEISSKDDSKQADRALTFHLNAPLVIER